MRKAKLTSAQNFAVVHNFTYFSTASQFLLEKKRTTLFLLFTNLSSHLLQSPFKNKWQRWLQLIRELTGIRLFLLLHTPSLTIAHFTIGLLHAFRVTAAPVWADHCIFCVQLDASVNLASAQIRPIVRSSGFIRVAICLIGVCIDKTGGDLSNRGVYIIICRYYARAESRFGIISFPSTDYNDDVSLTQASFHYEVPEISIIW